MDTGKLVRLLVVWDIWFADALFLHADTLRSGKQIGNHQAERVAMMYASQFEFLAYRMVLTLQVGGINLFRSSHGL